MYTTDFAYDGPIFLVPLSPSYPSSSVHSFNGIVKGTLLHYKHMNFVLKIYVEDPGQFLIYDYFTVVSIVKSTFKE